MELEEFLLGAFTFVLIIFLILICDVGRRVQKIEHLINNNNECITVNDIKYCINE